MYIEPVAKSSLVDTVVARIRGLIEQGRLRAGDRLPTESELVERLQVSRGALREAVRRLETLGLLTVAQGRGMFVAEGGNLSGCAQLFRSALSISPKDSLQFAEFRAILECHTARRAAERATPADVAELDRLREAKKRGDAEGEAVRMDWEFHRKLAEIAGNELVLNTLVVLQEFIVAGIRQTAYLAASPEAIERADQLHRAIVDAVRAQDPDRAERAMHAHMDALVRALEGAQQQTRRPRARRPAAPAVL